MTAVGLVDVGNVRLASTRQSSLRSASPVGSPLDDIPQMFDSLQSIVESDELRGDESVDWSQFVTAVAPSHPVPVLERPSQACGRRRERPDGNQR